MCDICNGSPKCPVCGDYKRYQECTNCNGEGIIYFDENGAIITEEKYNSNSGNYFKEVCEICNGEKEIEI